MRRCRRSAAVAAGCALALVFSASARASAQVLELGSGSAFDLGSAVLDAGCGDLVVAGTLALGSGSASRVRDVTITAGGSLVGEAGDLALAGDWNNTGSFAAGSGTVRVVDGCGRASATIHQSNSFYRLYLSTAVGKLFQFEAGSTQQIERRFEANGALGSLLRIRSTADGFAANLDLAGGHATSFLDVRDNHQVGFKTLFGAGSVDSGNTEGWVFGAVPAIPVAGLLLATAAIAFAARRRNEGPGEEPASVDSARGCIAIRVSPTMSR
jgi:hypothetical protein